MNPKCTAAPAMNPQTPQTAAHHVCMRSNWECVYATLATANNSKSNCYCHAPHSSSRHSTGNASRHVRVQVVVRLSSSFSRSQAPQADTHRQSHSSASLAAWLPCQPSLDVHSTYTEQRPTLQRIPLPQHMPLLMSHLCVWERDAG